MDIKEAYKAVKRNLMHTDFRDFTAEDMEQMAADHSDESNSILSGKAEGEADDFEVQREIADSLDLAIMSWLWAANAHAAAGNRKRFEKAIDDACTQSVKATFYPQFEKPGYFEAREHVLRTLRHNKGELYDLVREGLKEPMPKTYRIEVYDQTVEYTPEEQRKFLEEAVEFLHDHVRSMVRVEIPDGEKSKALGEKREAIGKRIHDLEETKKSLSWWTWRKKRKLASDWAEVREAREELLEEEKSYRLVDDAQVYESKDGGVSVGFGNLTLGYYDLRVPGNRMIFETRAWHAKKNSGKPGFPELLHKGKIDTSYPDTGLPPNYIVSGQFCKNASGWMLTRHPDAS